MCVHKRKPKIFGFKNVMKRGISKIITLLVIRLNKTEALVISKRLKGDRTDTNLIAPLRMQYILGIQKYSG